MQSVTETSFTVQMLCAQNFCRSSAALEHHMFVLSGKHDGIQIQDENQLLKYLAWHKIDGGGES